jgi:hypothetical protein
MAEQSRGKLLEFIGREINGPFMRLGMGFSSMAGNMNPQEQTRTYINDFSSTTTTGYQPEWPMDGNIYNGDPANDLLYDMTWNRVRGDDATVYLVRVKGWEEGDAPGSFKAYRQFCNWAPGSDGGGAGGEDNTFSGTLRAKGDKVDGEAVITRDPNTGFETCVFTANDQ